MVDRCLPTHDFSTRDAMRHARAMPIAFTDSRRPGRPPTRGHRGIALVVALAVVLIVLSLILVTARQMQTHATASRNQTSSAQARLIAEGAARALAADLTRIRNEGGELEDLIVPVEAGRIGDGLYWLLAPSDDDDRSHHFGLISEAAKVNVNTAGAAWLASLPQMDAGLVAAIIDWRDDDAEVTTGGAESEYYMVNGSAGYIAKDGPLETLGELLMLRDFNRDILYGEDANHNGVLDDSENDAGPRPPHDNGDGILQRGLAPYITVVSREPNVIPGTQTPRVNANTATVEDIRSTLQPALGDARAAEVADALVAARPHPNIVACLARANITADESPAIEDRLTTVDNPMLVGRLNICLADEAAIEGMPGLEEGDAARLVAARSAGADLRSLHWVLAAFDENASVSNATAITIGGLITSKSYQYAADIIAVSGDGRGFHRMHIIIDTATPGAARIVYIRDLTSLGWPLDAALLDDLRAGVSADDIALRASLGGAG